MSHIIFAKINKLTDISKKYTKKFVAIIDLLENITHKPLIQIKRVRHLAAPSTQYIVNRYMVSYLAINFLPFLR